MEKKEETGMVLDTVARMHSQFPTKFGVPRQSGLVRELVGKIVFEPPYRDPEALRGLEGFSHLWLIWGFHKAVREGWSATVRPPRLGGNARMGVFATRSPYRPNELGLSCVQLERVELHTPEGPVIWVSGADLMDGTPIYDIKPYVPYADAHPEAREGFATTPQERLPVHFAPGVEERIAPEERQALIGVLACDPRPRYQHDPERVYGMEFGGMEVRFKVGENGVQVVQVEGKG